MSLTFEEIKKLPKFPVEESWQLPVSALGKKLLALNDEGEQKTGLTWVTDSYGIMAVRWQVFIAHRPFVLITFVKNETLRIQLLALESQEITFGTKLYFECSCGKHCLKLYSRPEFYGFGCRSCQCLVYEVTRANKRGSFSAFRYYLGRKQKIQLMNKAVKRIVYRKKHTRRASAVLKAIAKWKFPSQNILAKLELAPRA